jgi:hypothetical protein
VIGDGIGRLPIADRLIADRRSEDPRSAIA